jgi:DNA-binding SARP family transcriptional activator
VLLLHAGQVVSIDRIAERLYGDELPLTAVTQVHRQVSELRRLLGDGDAIETRPPGYRMRLAPGQLDLERFEQLTAEGATALARGDAERAGAILRDALALWSGEPLADLAFEPFAALAAARLEELRLGAIEARIEADLACGQAAGLIAELDTLVAEAPLRERLHAHRILALYRAGRQRDALQAYRELRRALVEAFGIEPTPPLRELERRILRHDPALLAAATPAPAAPARSILVATADGAALDALLALAQPLAAGSARELVVVELVADAARLGAASAALAARRPLLDVPARAAAFTSRDAAADVVHLETTNEADLVLVAGLGPLDGPSLPPALATLLERAAADVAVLAPGGGSPGDGVVAVPFAGGEHDWAALETAAWLAGALQRELRLVGAAADDDRRRDASRLLADASLAIQRLAGIDALPQLVASGPDGLLDAIGDAGVVVVGLSPRWRADGLGTARADLVRRAAAPTLVVHRGLRPGGLAPASATTRYTWSAG